MAGCIESVYPLQASILNAGLIPIFQGTEVTKVTEYVFRIVLETVTLELHRVCKKSLKCCVCSLFKRAYNINFTECVAFRAMVRYVSVVRVKWVHQMDMEIRRRPHLKAYTVPQNVNSVIHNTSPR